MATYAEMIIERMVQKNTTLLGTKHCEAVSISGPLRLANANWRALIDLAMNALAGQSTKEIAKGVVPAVPADFIVALTTTNRYVGLLIRVSGAKLAFKQGDVILTVTGTGMSPMKFAMSPLDTHIEMMLLLTSDNAGVGSIAAPTNIQASWLLADHPEVSGLEYVVELESISLRDFTARERAY
jgi:hypothetical protein